MGSVGTIQNICPKLKEDSVVKFYAGKRIFLTGATGFIGKLFLEKVLRSCPDVEGIYCLVREKKGKSAKERMHEICQGPAFNILRKENEDFESKIHVILGDILGNEHLGMNETDRIFLHENIDIIVHAAADVSFNLTLKVAIERNLLPIKAVADLAKNMKYLKAFVHVSTAYANCDRTGTIEEKVYPTAVDPQSMIALKRFLDEDKINNMFPTLLGNHPNTYTLTKKLAEVLLTQEAKNLPLVIVRPSITINCQHEPLVGFCDQRSAFSSAVIGFGKAYLSTLYCHGDVIFDLVPADHCVNIIITAAWRKAVLQQNDVGKPEVYHASTGQLNPLCCAEFDQYGVEACKKWPFKNAIGEIKPGIYTSSRLKNLMSLIFLHILPGLLIDLFLAVSGRKPMAVKTYVKLIKNSSSFEYFVNNSWVFSTQNTLALQSCLSPEEKQIFKIDVKSIEWKGYIETIIKGIKMYVLKEDLKDVERTRLFIKRLRWIQHIIKFVLVASVLLALYVTIL